MDPPKRKVTVKVTEASPQRNYVNRSPSPHKPSPSPTFRPKAKVNSSATSSLVARKATSNVSISASSSLSRTASVKSATSSTTRSLTPRSGSPSKQPSPAPRARAAVTRGVVARAPGTQDPRRGSLSGGGESSASRGTTVSAILDLSDDDDSPAASPRITAKLSGLSRQASNEFPPSPILPQYSSLRAHPHRARVPSVSSNASSSSSPLYPGTAAATPASTSNSHRYPSPRTSPSSGSPGPQFYQSFPRDDASSPKYSARPNGGPSARVDPAAIPLPPHSPPTSALSFSSRSSLSLSGPSSSVGYATESGTSQLSAPRHANGQGHGRRESLDASMRSAADANVRSGLEQLMSLSGMAEDAGGEEGDGGYSEDEAEPERDEEQLRASTAERKVRAEAKSVRKIADLEITNRSLLAINTTLEQTKHRQAKELRELRRKLRESRLILPPRAFRAVKSSLDHDDTADEDDDDEDEDEDDDEEEGKSKGGDADGDKGKGAQKDDATYRRVKALLDGLLEAGRRALATTPQDFPEPVKVAKVLSAYEVPQPYLSDGEGDGEDGPPPPPSPAHVAVPDSDSDGDEGGKDGGDGDGLASEDEVEAMTLPRDSPPPSPSPPPSAAPPIEISERPA
ncbi:hypothetical protein B0H11DRAFT_2242726 [Mycena galericulata]|nr:hypothetical protein B0H11DRAFT_2242726 [Mycena galericulata]